MNRRRERVLGRWSRSGGSNPWPGAEALDGSGLAAAVRSRAVVERAAGWVLPTWLARQSDPRSPVFTPAGSLLSNVSGRNATAVGTLDGGRGALVDGRGLVVPVQAGGRSRGWSLDWWIGSGERWHVPSREAGVRQALVQGTPVVETCMRVPGGDVIHRVFGARVGTEGGGRDVVVVEVENRSGVPVALALSVRPYDLDGWTVVGEVELDGHTVLVDGTVALVSPRSPGEAVAGTWETGDAAATVLAAPAGPHDPSRGSPIQGTGEDPYGTANLSLVHALTHLATVRVLVPMDGAGSVGPTTVPDADAVASGWQLQTGGGPRLDLPDPRLQEAFEASRRHLALAAGSSWSDTVSARVLVAQLWAGSGDDGRSVRALAGSLGARAHGASEPPRATDPAALLWALGRCVTRGLDLGWLGTRVPELAGAAQQLGDAPPDHRSDPEGAVWTVAGLRGAATVLDALGEVEAARGASRLADRALAGADGHLAHHLAAVFPLGILDADTRRFAAAAIDAAVAGGVDVAATGPAGVDVRSLVDLAGAAATVGHPAADDLVARILDLATSTWTWPAVAHPRHGGGVAGPPHDVAVTAAFVSLVATLAAVDHADGVDLLPAVPRRWFGQGIEVHGLPTRWGKVSAAVRWHGPRPALLWEIEEVGGRPVLGAPGLDPTWTTGEQRGEALLAAPPDGPDGDETESPAAAPSPSASPEAGFSFG